MADIDCGLENSDIDRASIDCAAVENDEARGSSEVAQRDPVRFNYSFNPMASDDGRIFAGPHCRRCHQLFITRTNENSAPWSIRYTELRCIGRLADEHRLILAPGPLGQVEGRCDFVRRNFLTLEREYLSVSAITARVKVSRGNVNSKLIRRLASHSRLKIPSMSRRTYVSIIEPSGRRTSRNRTQRAGTDDGRHPLIELM